MKQYLTRRNAIKAILLLLVALSLVASLWTSYKVLTLQKGEKVAVGPLTVSKPDNKIVKGYVDDSGNLIFAYSDGTTRNVGHVSGSNGQNGLSLGPSSSQVAAVVSTYCANGACGQTPTPAQVATAISNYCANSACVGAKGQDAAPVTTDMLINAVTAYCANGACAGPTGPTGATGGVGPTGADGRTTAISCVERTTNSLDTYYVDWKYTDEPDSAYRDLYKLPSWAQGSNCVDLRGTA